MRSAVAALALLLAACASPPAAPGGPFPEGWVGARAGDLEVLTVGGEARTVPMALRIAPTEDPNVFVWAIRYGEEPVRDYRLHVRDRERGEYAIDEGSSIVIPAWLVGGELITIFAVSGSRLTIRYRMRGEAIRFEALSAPSAAAGATGGEGGVPAVETFRPTVLQRATLRLAPSPGRMRDSPDAPLPILRRGGPGTGRQVQALWLGPR